MAVAACFRGAWPLGAPRWGGRVYGEKGGEKPRVSRRWEDTDTTGRLSPGQRTPQRTPPGASRPAAGASELVTGPALPRASAAESDTAGSGAAEPRRARAGASRLPPAEVERPAACRGARSHSALQPLSGPLAGPRMEKPRPGRARTCEVGGDEAPHQ